MITIEVEFSNGTILNFTGRELKDAYEWAKEHAKEHHILIKSYEIIDED